VRHLAAATVGRRANGWAREQLETKYMGICEPLTDGDTVEVEGIGGRRVYTTVTRQATGKTCFAHQFAGAQ